jgi:hypothetical protein
MTRNGIAFRLPPLVRITNGIESGLLLPTPLTVSVSTGKAEQTYQSDLKRVGNPTWQAVLAVAERKWPTPTAQDAKNSTLPPSQKSRDSLPGALLREGLTGGLNPEWVEWLMGFPAGWTDLEPSATPSSRRSQK